MIARWKDLCVDVTAPLAGSPEPAFWAAVLGLQAAPHRATVERLGGDTPERTVWLNAVPEPRTTKNRVHLDVHAGAVEQIEALGARRLSAPSEFRWTVMADPEGQEFCVFVREQVPAYRLYEIVVDCTDPAALAAWWQAVWGGDTGADGPDEAWIERIPGAPFESVVFGAVPEPKTVKNRVHWDVVAERADALAALVAHGATILRRRDEDIDWDVLADPEGNEFCLFAPS